jgi:hypothetical protein
MKSEIRKALEVSGTGQYLVPEDVEPLIRYNLQKLSPLTAMVPVITADGHIHEVVRRTAHNAGARFEGESTAPSYSESTFERRTVTMKILRTAGQVSDFQQSAARSFADSLAEEVESALQGLKNLFEYSTVWGAGNDIFTGDAYQYSGVYPWLLNDGSLVNIVDADGTITLEDLDAALDATKEAYGEFRNDPYVFLASGGMISKISGLQSKINRDVQMVEFEGGFRMATYREIPIVNSGYLKPLATTTSPAVTAAAGGDGTGNLTDDEYFYQVASITINGEQIAGTEDSVTLSGGGSDQNVDLSWTADSTALLYAIYRGLTTGTDNLELIDIIAAKTYDSTGAVDGSVEAYDDTTALTPTYSSVHPMAAAEETLFLVNLSTRNGLARPILNPTLGDPVNELVRFAPIPVSSDSYAFRLKSYHAVQVPWGQSCAVIRRAKPS